MIDRYGRIAAGDRRLADVLRSVVSVTTPNMMHDAKLFLFLFLFYWWLNPTGKIDA